jgi:hypothetical protein
MQNRIKSAHNLSDNPKAFVLVLSIEFYQDSLSTS